MTHDDESLDPPEWVSRGGVRRQPPRDPTLRPDPRRDRGSQRRVEPRNERRAERRTAPGRDGSPERRSESGDGRGPGRTPGRNLAREAPDASVASRGERRRHRRRSLTVLGIVLLPVVLVGAGVGWFLWELNPPGSPGDKVVVQVADGTGTGEIGSILQDKGVIGSSRAYDIYTTLTRAGPFDPGRYTFRESQGVRDAVNVLKSGPQKGADLVLTIPPGLTLQQIADRVGKLPKHNAQDFLTLAQSGQIRSRYEPAGVNSLEGLLEPDTYFLGADDTDADILQRLVSTFDDRADAIGLANPNAAGLDPYQTIVAASLIEREAGVDEDRPLIAAVIRNRIQQGMRLQIDATVCYAKGGCPTALSRADLEIDSPYNTYKIQGLPPTPISGVTTKSLQAAQNPANVPYLFYVLADKNGKHAFAVTNEEHEKNVQAAREKGLL